MVETNTSLSKTTQSFAELYQLVKALRDPQTGCPWDLEQTHESLCPFLLEEAYEAVDAIRKKENAAVIAAELGDVLLQVVLHAQIASEQNKFSFDDVISSLKAKLIRRHPHVFGSEEEKKKRSRKEIKENWLLTKKKEEAEKKQVSSSRQSLLGKDLLSRKESAATQAYKIGRVCEKINFDWDEASAVTKHLLSELQEFTEAYQLLDEDKFNTELKDKMRDELGDCYFTLAQLCRHLQLQPEDTAYRGNEKFVERFHKLEELAQQKKTSPTACHKDELEGLWQEAKRL